ncbi:hypothetical protein IQ251_13615 [Saccharopolyspora sp. HNM0983]|uniref:Uncharacterized protein n=1 Tax=Saccharopolyspora montiporae TaxID=2781240 RepID=A0A929G0D2_9PSEU|nr:hypothetical protein [Saccharopolyspora sp. HNM0983]
MSGWAKAPDLADRPAERDRVRRRTAADREEQLTGGLRPVECTTCGARVLARKNSPQHTSIQWTGDAAARCPELTGTAGGSCAALRARIDTAVDPG